MFCTKCGTQVNDECSFCTNCGASLKKPDITADSAAENTAQAPTNVTPNAIKQSIFSKFPKNKKLFIPAVAAVLVAAATIVSFASPTIKTLWIKAFNSPEGYFHYVMKENAEIAAERLANFADSCKNTVATGCEADLKLTVGDGMKELVGSLDDEAADYIDWINTVDLKLNSTAEGDKAALDVAASLNDVDLGNFEYIIDGDAQYIGFPKASKTYIKQDSYMDLPNQSFSNMTKLVPEKAIIENLAYKYSVCAANQITKVDESSEKISANGVEQNVTKLTATIDQKTAMNIATEVLTEIKSDKDFKQLIKNTAEIVDSGSDYDEAYEDIMDSVDDALEDIENIEAYDDISVDVHFYVNSSSEIVGIEFGSKELGGKLTCYTAESGSHYGTYMLLQIDDTSITVNGNGKNKGRKQSGDYEIELTSDYYDDYNYKFNVSLTDVDTSLLEKGIFNGKAVFSLPKDTIELALEDSDIPSIASSVISKMSLVFESKTKDSGKPVGSIEFMNEDDSLLRLDFAIETNSGKKFGTPDDYIYEDNDDYYDEAEEIAADVIDYLSDKLEDANVPDDIINELEDSLEYEFLY